MPTEEKNFFRQIKEDTIVDIYIGCDVIITHGEGEIKDYKQSDYNRVTKDGFYEDADGNRTTDDTLKGKEKFPTTIPALQEVKIKNKTFDCFSYELPLSSNNYSKEKTKLMEYSLIEKILDENDNSKKLYELYKANKLYYKDSIERTFYSLDMNARKRVISNAEKEAKKEFERDRPYGYNVDFERGVKGTFVASYLYANWLPDLEISLLFSPFSSSFSLPLIIFPNPEDAFDKQLYYIRTLKWKKQGGNIEIVEFDQYKLPNLYKLKRTYYTEGQKDYNRIATQGCLITCYADVITFYYQKNGYRKAQDPHQVKDRMQEMDWNHYELKKEGSKPGFGNGLNMENKNVAEDYGFEYIQTNEVEKESAADNSKMFLGKIKDKIDEDLPTIARLSLGEDTHYVVVVGLRYNEKNNPIEYVIIDPGRRDYIADSDKEWRKYTINCESRVYEHSKKKMDRIYFLNKK